MCDRDGNIDRNTGSDIYVNGNIDINSDCNGNTDRIACGDVYTV